MFKGLFRKSDTAQRYQSAGADLGVFTLSLQGVEDPFDVDPLWDRKYGGMPGIVEQMSGDNEFRLQAALDGCRDVKFARDDAGRFREQSPVFTDVVVWIAAKRWSTDAMHGGRRIEALTTNLAALHVRKFGRSVPAHRKPIYTVMPDEALADDAVVFQFGFGVFVPTSWDVLEGSVKLQLGDKGEPSELPTWSFWRDGAQLRRPVGYYRGQDSLLISADNSTPVRAPIWLKHGKGYISINLNTADSDRVFTDAEHIVVAKTTEPSKTDGVYRCVLKSSGPGTAKMTLILQANAEPKVNAWPDEETPKTQIARKPPNPEPPVSMPGEADKKAAPKKKRRAGSDKATEIVSGDNATEFIAGPGPEGQPVDRQESEQTPISTRYTLKLAGCALLRIDGERYVEGLDDWTIWFDENGQPIDFERADSYDTGEGLALAATANESLLFYRLPGQTEFKTVQAMPCVLATTSGGYIELQPPAIPSVYHGIVQLSSEISFPLSPKPLILGRSNITPEADQPDLPLELLNHPDGLHWAPGSGYAGAKLNSLNLSRRHVSVQLDKNELKVAMVDGKMPIYVLDENGKSLRTLEPGASRPDTLKPGQQFLIGNYLVRFHEETPRTMLSRDVSRHRNRPSEHAGA
ncbi:MAG: hypothetical protein ACTSUD_12695 [Alphaproteobacteria bacterium]